MARGNKPLDRNYFKKKNNPRSKKGTKCCGHIKTWII